MNNNDQLVAAAIAKLQKLEMQECFDPSDLTSRPTKTQQKFLDDIEEVTFRYVLGGNQSGKSQLGAREVSWLFTDTHPTFVRPKRWGVGGIQLIVMGRTMTQVEDTLWRKVKSLIPAGSYKEVKVGNTIKKAIHKETGNTILFMSHHGVDEASDKAQSFEAHYVWVDEMPKKIRIIEELHRRVQANSGRFIATFTPKVINSEIKKLVDRSSRPYAEKYQLLMFDNPRYTEEDKAGILDSLKTHSKAYQATVLHGEWMSSDDSVYQFTDDMIEMPPNYSRLWRHVESVDPAIKSKAGYTLWAEDPNTAIWYCVKAEYLEGIFDPNELYATCVQLSSGHNVVRKVCDPHEGWFLGIASAAKCTPAYVVPYSKNNRKAELIKGLQDKLGSRLRISPTCDKLVMEFEECRWNESGDTAKIVNASRFHLLDTAQYFADLIPKYEGNVITAVTWYDDLRQKNTQRVEAEAKNSERKKKAAMRVMKRSIRKPKRNRSVFGRILDK